MDKFMYKLKLYIVGQTPQSDYVIKEVTEFLLNSCKDEHILVIVDILLNPSQAIDDGVFVSPTLVMMEPPRRVIGSFKDSDKLSEMLFGQYFHLKNLIS